MNEPKKSTIKYSNGKVIVDSDYLRKKNKKSTIKTVVCQSIYMVCSIVFLCYLWVKKSDVFWFFLIFLNIVPLVGIIRDLVGLISKKEKQERNIYFLKTVLTDKKFENGSSGDINYMQNNELIFEYLSDKMYPTINKYYNDSQGHYLFRKSVKDKDFLKRQIGDECYLMLALGKEKSRLYKEKKPRYYLREVFWEDEHIIGKEFEEKFITNEEVAEVNRFFNGCLR